MNTRFFLNIAIYDIVQYGEYRMFLTRKALKNIRLLSGAYYVLGVLVLIISIIFAFMERNIQQNTE